MFDRINIAPRVLAERINAAADAAKQRGETDDDKRYLVVIGFDDPQEVGVVGTRMTAIAASEAAWFYGSADPVFIETRSGTRTWRVMPDDTSLETVWCDRPNWMSAVA